MNIDFKRQILPHVIAIVAFVAITVGYFNPVFFENKELNQYDIQQWEGGARELLDYRDQTGKEGLWTNSMFSGMPGYLINVEWSDKAIEYLHRVYTLGLPHPVRVIFASFLSYYLMLLAFGIRPYLAIGVAVAFGLSSFMIIGLSAGHNARIGAIAYMPLVIAGIHLALNGKRWLGFGVTTAGLAMHLRFNHLQITYYLLLIVLIYGAVYLYVHWKKGELKAYLINLGLLSVAALIAVGSMFGKFWSTYEYGKYSMRGPSELTAESSSESTDGLNKDYAFQYSNSIFEPFTLFIPDFMGGSSSNFLVADEDSETLNALRRSGDQQTANQLARFSGAYWGKQPLTAPYYAGAVIGFLFVIGILFADKSIKTWLLLVFTLGIILSWGSNFSTFNYFMFDYFPGYNKFRSVTFTIVMAIFSIGLLGAHGTEKLLKDGFNKNSRRQFFIAFGVFAGICVLLIVGAGMINMHSPSETQLPAWFTSALADDRASLLRKDAFRTLIFASITFGTLWLTLTDKLRPAFTLAIIALAITIDMWSVDSRYVTDDNFQRNAKRNFFSKTEADKVIQEDKSLNYRVYNLQSPWNEARTSYYHKSLGGYHGAKLRRYQDLYDRELQPETQELIQKLQAGETNYNELGVLNMLNTKYIYFGPARNNVFKNNFANGNAWLVSNVQLVNSPDEEIAQLNSLDTKNSAVMDGSKFDPGATTFNNRGTIELTSYTPNKLVYNYISEDPSLAVFSEIYYPKGWTVSIDGTEEQILRANYVLRALEIPAGNHTIEFIFEPIAYVIGNKITAIFSVIVILSLAGGIYLHLRNVKYVAKE